MNVYDFDNTIYDGESAVDFYLYLLGKNYRLIKFIPKILVMLIKYKLCIMKENELVFQIEKYAKSFFDSVDDLNTLVSEFWDKNQHKIKQFYLNNKKADDVILSASFDFLLDEICDRLDIKTVLTSKIDRQTGRITRLCFGENKVKVFKEAFPGVKASEFYTDSMNDEPMFKLSEKNFLVKGNCIKELII